MKEQDPNGRRKITYIFAIESNNQHEGKFSEHLSNKLDVRAATARQLRPAHRKRLIHISRSNIRTDYKVRYHYVSLRKSKRKDAPHARMFLIILRIQLKLKKYF
jgi:hypothetical protein